MSDCIEVVAIVEGKTEQDFIRKILAPYLAGKSVFITPIQVNKPGSKGGDVKFSRVKNDIDNFLKQRSDTVITTFLDLYGLKEWPDLDGIFREQNHENMINKLYESTDKALKDVFDDYTVEQRIIPFFSIYEFEALLFSNPEKLAEKLNCSKDLIINILAECGEPEKINNSPHTAPSKRLDVLSIRKKFKKTTQGIAIASDIGIDEMREKCPQFNFWLNRLESLQVVVNEA